MRADLHSHTCFSDGMLPPKETLKRAKEAGLTALGITDHDTLAGWSEAREWSGKLGVEWVPGIEVSTYADGRDVHVLGYYVNEGDQRFLEQLVELRQVRQRRNEMMVQKLQELGLSITWEEVLKKQLPDGNLGRPHIAAVMVEKGLVKSMDDAFDVYLGTGGKAYVKLQRITPVDAVEMIHRAGGAAVLAHPGIYRRDDLVMELVSNGLDGIEVYHPDHSSEDTARYLRMTQEHQLLATAGSDFHGERKEGPYHAPLGSQSVPYDVVTALQERSSFWSS